MSKKNLSEHTQRLLARKSGKKAKATKAEVANEMGVQAKTKMQTTKTPKRQEHQAMDSDDREFQPANKGKATSKPRTQMKVTIAKSTTQNAQPEPHCDAAAGFEATTGSETVSMGTTPDEVAKIDAAVEAAVAIEEKPATETKASKKTAKTPKRQEHEAMEKPATVKNAANPIARGPARLSALDAAEMVLAEDGIAMNAAELITAMADQHLWTSTSGKTPANTLHAAISTEIKKKGAQSRFAKAERGKFIRKA